MSGHIATFHAPGFIGQVSTTNDMTADEFRDVLVSQLFIWAATGPTRVREDVTGQRSGNDKGE